MNTTSQLPFTARNTPTAKNSFPISQNPFFEAEILAHELIETLLQESDLLLYENSLDKISKPFAVSSTIAALLSLVELGYLRHEPFKQFDCDEHEEPCPAPIDPWARNVIRVVTKVKIAQEPEALIALTSKSRKSGKSGGSVKGILKKARVRAGLTAVAVDEGISPIRELQEEIDEGVEEIRRKKEKELKKKKEELDKVMKMIEEEKELDEKLLKEEEKLKGTELTYDYRGNIVMVSPVVFGNYFADSQPVRYKPEQSPVEIKTPSKLQFSRRDPLLKKKHKIKQPETEWVKNIVIKQNPIVEHMSLSPNVTLTQNYHKVLPPKIKHSTLSRKEYLQSTTPTKSPINPTPTDKRSLSFSSLKSGKRPSKKDYLETLPDYEVVPQTPLPTISTPQSVSPVNLREHGRVFQYATEKTLEPLRPIDKFNLEIMNNKQWGINPPLGRPVIVSRVPHKLNLKEIREIYGDIVKKPKDQPFMTVEELWREKSEGVRKPKDRPHVDKVIKKKKMPPAPFGQSMLHGWSKGE